MQAKARVDGSSQVRERAKEIEHLVEEAATLGRAAEANNFLILNWEVVICAGLGWSERGTARACNMTYRK